MITCRSKVYSFQDAYRADDMGKKAQQKRVDPCTQILEDPPRAAADSCSPWPNRCVLHRKVSVLITFTLRKVATIAVKKPSGRLLRDRSHLTLPRRLCSFLRVCHWPSLCAGEDTRERQNGVIIDRSNWVFVTHLLFWKIVRLRYLHLLRSIPLVLNLHQHVSKTYLILKPGAREPSPF
jgi:hypothetical protein